MPRSPGRHRRPAPAPLTAPPTSVEAPTAVGPVVPAEPVTEPAASDVAVAESARRRPGRVAVATAGGTGAVALAIALLTVAAGPARNGDPTHHQPLAGPSGGTPAVPSSVGSTSTGADQVGQDASLGGGAAVLAAAQRRTALPVAPSTAPPMAGPTATATPAASPTPTKPGQRRGATHHPPAPTPTPTPTGTSDAQAADLGQLPVPTLP